MRLLCLTAHPDDEAGAFGGALLMASERGYETAVVCLTDGAAGSYREPGQSDQELAALRREELARSSAVLKVRHSELMGYGDGKLREEPFLPLVEVLIGVLRRLRPHVVLTFGGEGGVNLHRDHSIVSLAGTAAFHWAARADFLPGQGEPWAAQKLYYAATPFLSSADEHIQATGTRTPASLRYRLGAAIGAQKLEAFRQHSSQARLLAMVQERFGDVFAEESYLLAAARQPTAHERDIWDGVVLQRK